ncbi:MAG: hypothetical protein MI757_09025 [Pirellulales bacterium]|nr:hypothetical protein [Pirellulales bacterium]
MKPLPTAIVEHFAADPLQGYLRGQAPASEVVALTAIALTAHGESDAANAARTWLADAQEADGSISAREGMQTPRWPTSLAIIAWSLDSTDGYRNNIAQAVDWMLDIRGTTIPNGGPSEHDTMLVGWPWVDGTHSWLEPTAWALLALRAAGLGEHNRANEAEHLLLDRTLESGGCNYGNTVVLGQTLRPHVQPTGLAMLALSTSDANDGRISKSLDYLTSEMRPRQATASLCYATLGLAAHDRLPNDWQRHVDAAARRAVNSEGTPLQLALAYTAQDCPLINISRGTLQGPAR